MRFFLRVAVVFLLVLSALSFLRKAFSSEKGRSTPRSPSSGPNRSRAGKLVKDPICGTYITPKGAISASRAGETFHFCSDECREKFVATGT